MKFVSTVLASTSLATILLIGTALAQPNFESAGSRWDQVAPLAQQELQSQKPSTEKLLSYCDVALREGRLPQALQIYQAVVRLEPLNEKGWMGVVQCLTGLGEAQKGRQALESLRKLSPDDPEVLALDGMLSFLEEKYSQGEQLLDRALSEGKGRSGYQGRLPIYANSLIVALYQQGKKAEALRRTEEFLLDYPQAMDLLLSASRLYRESGQYHKALQAAQKGVELYPQRPNFYAALSLAEARLGHKQESENAYLQLKKLHPGMAQAVRDILDGKDGDKPQIQVEMK